MKTPEKLNQRPHFLLAANQETLNHQQVIPTVCSPLTVCVPRSPNMSGYLSGTGVWFMMVKSHLCSPCRTGVPLFVPLYIPALVTWPLFSFTYFLLSRHSGCVKGRESLNQFIVCALSHILSLWKEACSHHTQDFSVSSAGHNWFSGPNHLLVPRYWHYSLWPVLCYIYR